MPEEKNIIDEFNFHFADDEDDRFWGDKVRISEVRQFLLTELQALKEEVTEKAEPAEGDASRFNYPEDWYVGYNRHRQETIEAFEKRGI